MIIDAHQHFWNYSPQKHSWINSDMGILKKDFLPSDLLETYKENGVSGCVAIQAEQSEEETLFLLQLAEDYDFIKGVVGWLDLRSPDLEDRIKYFRQFKKLKGLRHVVQDEPDPNFLLDPDFQKGLGLLEKYELTYDLLVYPHQLNAAIQTVENFPNLKFVLDHIAKPPIKDQVIAPWEDAIGIIGSKKNAYCKISGMVTEASWTSWKVDDFVPYLDTVFRAFGIDRIMFGSDWPVCLLAGNYAQVLGLVKNYSSRLNVEEKNKLFYENAASFYGLRQ
ncbi:MAG TPA: amidohydrolase family protein [Cyclobacteriaceae bacterium]|nr:amidohydrolase family protein [Cyclobacteriaceae bacterium]